MNAKLLALATLLLAAAGLSAAESAGADPYEEYVKTSKDFKPVRADKKFLTTSLPGWSVMPWYAHWPIGHDDAAGKFCEDNGINGAFIDRGNTGYLAWIDQFKLRFYADHSAGKGDLHLWDGGPGNHKGETSGTGVRVKPLNAAMLEHLKGVLKDAVNGLKKSPMRGAYALDDEISWGSFIAPCMWQATDDQNAYRTWLAEVYGKDHAPAHPGWIGYNDLRGKLKGWDLASFDASQLMDQWSFNDSVFDNMIGDLVDYSNSLDPDTPCGFVGGMIPNAFGGFDYAKVTRKIQFIESYGAHPYVCSLNPLCTEAATLFFRSSADAIWQSWDQVANGVRAMIIWYDNGWWDGNQPKPFLKELAPTWKELAGKIAPLITDSERQHDPIAFYYSHASIQLAWIMDAEAHGSTWPNRSASADPGLGCHHLGRNAWMAMVADDGFDAPWIDYVTVIQKGFPADLKVLILPAATCLSDAEAKRIKAFVEKGGTLIADYMPGLWDQHGKGRATGGALDDVFGVKHDPHLKCSGVFGGDLWCETNQDSNFGKSVEQQLTNENKSIKDASGFDKAVRDLPVAKVNTFGKGKAVLLNLSPLWYLVYRGKGGEEAAKRSIFTKYIADAGVKPRVTIKDPTPAMFGSRFITWTAGDRIVVFLLSNPDRGFSVLGGGNAANLRSDSAKVTIAFPASVADAKDERTGKALGAGKEFSLDWKLNEAVVLSYKNPNAAKTTAPAPAPPAKKP